MNAPIPITFRGERPEQPAPGDAYFVPETDVVKREDGATAALGMTLSAQFDAMAAAKVRPIAVVLPSGYHFLLHAAFWGKGENPQRQGWTVLFTAEPKAGEQLPVSLTPSVDIPGTYHGHIRDGVIGCNLAEAERADGTCPSCGLPLRGFLMAHPMITKEGARLALHHELCSVRIQLATMLREKDEMVRTFAAVLHKRGGTEWLHRIDFEAADRALKAGPLRKIVAPDGSVTVELGPEKRIVPPTQGQILSINGREPKGA